MIRHLVASVLGIACAVSAYAAPAPPARCEQLKLVAAGKAALRLLHCHARAVGTGVGPDPGCLTLATDRLAATFAKAELKNTCSFTGEASSVATTLRTLGGDLALATGAGPSGCGSRKILAAGTRAQRTLVAQAKHALAPERDTLGGALAKVDATFSARVANAESFADCAIVGDATTLASRIDAAAADVVDAVRGTLANLGTRDGRLIGAAVRANVLASMEPAYRDTLLRHFDYVTAEYEFMWGNLEPTRGSYLFGPVDTIVDFAAQHGMRVKGAPLVWHLILPSWVNDTMTPAELQSAIDQRIDTLVGAYAGKVAIWDVVNEATTDGGGAYRDSIFLQKLGPDYIRNAFVRARQADPNALLFYNDFLADGINAKSDFIYQMIAGLLAQGTPIDGVSMQMHLGGGFGAVPTKSSVMQNLQRFADLGLRVHVSEMDVETYTFPGEPSVRRAMQRTIYHDMVAACLAVTRCDSVTFWGFTDTYTWVGDYLHISDMPLPFDRKYRPKASFFGIRDALLGF